MSCITEGLEHYVSGFTHTISALISPILIYYQGDTKISICAYTILYLLSGLDSRLGILLSCCFMYYLPIISACFLLSSLFTFMISRFPFFVFSLSKDNVTIYKCILAASRATRQDFFCHTPQYLYSNGIVLIFTCKGLYVGKATFSNCCICLTDNLRCVEIECNHSICIECSSTWLSLNNTCPLCRKLL